MLGLVSQVNGDRVLFLILDLLDFDADEDLLLIERIAIQSITSFVTIDLDQLATTTDINDRSLVFVRLLDFEYLHVIQV